MKAKIAYLVRPGHFEIKEEEIQVSKTQVIIKNAVCGLCNWELLHWKGLYGTCPMPVGHEVAGIIVEIGSEVEKFKVGDKVTGIVMGSFSDYVVANVEDIIRLDDNIDTLYAFAEPLKCVMTVLRAATPEVGDVGVVVGCGPMGLWAIQALSGNTLSALIAVDIIPEHLEMAKKFGATHCINSNEEDVAKRIMGISNGHMADFVIEGTGNTIVLNNCVNYLKEEGKGRLVIMSTYHDSFNMTNIGQAIDKAIVIKVAHPNYSDNPADDLRRAVALINNGVFKTKDLVTHTFKLSDINNAFKTLENKPKGYLKGIVVPD